MDLLKVIREKVNPFSKTYSGEEKNFFRFLRGSRLFADLSDNELATVVPNIFERRYIKDEVVFFREDPAQALYIIKSGQVHLSLDIEDSFESLSRLGTQDYFGEEAFFDDTFRVYNAICQSEQTELYVIPTLSLIEIFENDTRTKSKVMSALAKTYLMRNSRLFKSYRESFGFFDLSQAYVRTGSEAGF